MKAVILAGGLGTRISEETSTIPKPMIEIGGRPLLWHIMKLYSHYGINDFIICLGYKGNVIKQYFANYYFTMSDVVIDLRNNSSMVNATTAEPWRITLVDTGENSMTGGRIRRIKEHVKGDDAFCLTYGDGLADVNIGDLLKFHKKRGKLATVTAVQATDRFGRLDISGDMVKQFKEKPKHDYINGGFFVLSPKTIDLIKDDNTIWERGPLESLVKKNELAAYKHDGFWHCVDTLRDKQQATELWDKGKAPWKLW